MSNIKTNPYSTFMIASLQSHPGDMGDVQFEVVRICSLQFIKPCTQIQNQFICACRTSHKKQFIKKITNKITNSWSLEDLSTAEKLKINYRLILIKASHIPHCTTTYKPLKQERDKSSFHKFIQLCMFLSIRSHSKQIRPKLIFF